MTAPRDVLVVTRVHRTVGRPAPSLRSGVVDPVAEPRTLLPLVAAREERYLATLEHLVGIDSGSDDVDGVNRVADVCGALLGERGWSVDRVPLDAGPPTGDALVARVPGGVPTSDGGRTVLLLAHMDTVFAPGTAVRRPFAVEGDRVRGPGVCDDKGGIVAGLTAVDVLVEAGHDGFAEIVYLLSPDEEIGSPASMELIRGVATEADVALCLECARENGDLVAQRKGVADYRIAITGRAAHAGVEPERGVDAALEAARKTAALHELNGRWPGVTVNVGVIRAGTRRNVVAAEAELEVDLRAWTSEVFEEAASEIEAIARRSFVDGSAASVRRASMYPPLERTAAVERLFGEAREVAVELGLEVDAVATGGSSDANTAASAGVPTLDGLGPVGGDDHSPSEWIALDSIVPRVTLLAGLIARLGTDRARGGTPRRPAIPDRADAGR